MDEKRQVARELHAPARRHYPRRRTVIKGYNDLFQADLLEMIPYARENRGYRYILMVIDAYSKYLWAAPVKRKGGKDVTEAMEQILSEGRVPQNLQTDHGREFYNPDFRQLMTRHTLIIIRAMGRQKPP